ncbi:Huntingtin-interacting protein 1 [Taenia solium]|eukprot:TsM_000857400 transcript=TsM_000857400 gene=TsM_000857400
MNFALALMDYLEVILNFQALVLTNVDSSPSPSSMSSNCRLASLTQCVRDCAALYDMALKAMIKLHSLMPAESLDLLRTRFSRLYLMLERFFLRANSYAYIRDFLKIPLLPNVRHLHCSLTICPFAILFHPSLHPYSFSLLLHVFILFTSSHPYFFPFFLYSFELFHLAIL